MAAELSLLKLEGSRQLAQLPPIAGKSFTLGKITAATDGFGKWLALKPVASAGSADIIAVKVQAGQNIAALAGKSVTVAKSPIIVGEKAGAWLALQNNTAVVSSGFSSVGATANGAVGLKAIPAAFTKAAPTIINGKAGALAIAGKAGAVGKASAVGVAGIGAAGATGSANGAAGGGLLKGASMLGVTTFGPVLVVGSLALLGVGIYLSKQDREPELEI